MDFEQLFMKKLNLDKVHEDLILLNNTHNYYLNLSSALECKQHIDRLISLFSASKNRLQKKILALNINLFIVIGSNFLRINNIINDLTNLLINFFAYSGTFITFKNIDKKYQNRNDSNHVKDFAQFDDYDELCEVRSLYHNLKCEYENELQSLSELEYEVYKECIREYQKVAMKLENITISEEKRDELKQKYLKLK